MVNEVFHRKGEWKYIYRAVDSTVDAVDFTLSAKRDRKAAKLFFKKALSSNHNQIPKVITVDKMQLIHLL